MGRLKNPREEGFARAVAVENKTLASAYRDAFNPTNPNARWVQVESSRVAQRPSVALRISELNDEIAANVGATREWAMARLHDAVDSLMQVAPVGETGMVAPIDAKTAATCIRLIADMAGWIEKGRPVDDEEKLRMATLRRLASMSDGELAAELARPVGPGHDPTP